MSEMNDSSPMSRHLAAIMFADIMGYTAMMQQDEHNAKSLRNRMRKTMEEKVPRYGGRIIQFYGDGMLSLFSSATNAVECAIEVQLALQHEPVVPLRIGLHSGDVSYDEHGAYGDSINVASRIESLSTPGGILISDKVYDEVKNQAAISTTSMGHFGFKNVQRNIEVYAVTNDGLNVPTISQTAVKAGSSQSIAVLPFVNLSTDPENEYFSDGVSEEILNALTRVEGLQVCSRTSSFVYKGQTQDVRQIGQKLGVASVLEGSVRKGGNKVRITAQLINAIDGYQVWSETFDRELDDIFRVQDEIAVSIVDRLKEKYAAKTPTQKTVDKRIIEHVVTAPTDNLEAYNLYLKGRFHWNKSNPEDIRKAISSLEKALALDPGFASANCLLSYCYAFMGSTGLMPYREAFSNAKDYTLRAIDLDPNHAESHLSLASIKFFQNWDFDGAEASLQKARELGLNSSLLNHVEGMVMISRGRFDEAVQKLKQAVRQEPLSLMLICLLADAYAFAGRFDEARAEYDKALEMDANFRKAYEGKGLTYLAEGNYDMAIENLEHYYKLVGNPLKGTLALGFAYGMAGKTEKAHEFLELNRERERAEPGVNLDLEYAMIYAGLKNYDMAIQHFRKIYDQRMSLGCIGMIYCTRYPILKELKSDPKFREVVAKMGLD